MSSGQPVSRVRVGPLDAPARAALADLLGLDRLPGEYATVSVSRLDAVLRTALGVGVADVVGRLVGPPADRAGDRRRAAAERAELWEWLERHPVVAAVPALPEWVAAVRRGGLVGGTVAETRRELERALAVLAELPAPGLPLPVFAERVLGDPHGLDDPGRCSGLVLRALAGGAGLPPPADSDARRELWERAGVAPDELSSTVLAAGFRLRGDDVVARVLRASAEAGQAAVLTLAQLRAAGDWTHLPPDVWAFENPAVRARARGRVGARGPPQVCIAGGPSAAGVLLLRRLTAGGATVHYHGDLDGDGLRIAANVVARTGARPWRMTSADYLAAAATGPPVGRVTPVPWDPDLAVHLTRVGTGVPEERVAAELLDELPR